MKLILLVSVILLINSTHSQNQDVINANIAEIFGSSTPDPFEGFGEEVTKKPMQGFGAQSRCGEGANQGKTLCVPYFQCHGVTRTIIQDGVNDGFGVIDIRFGESGCTDTLEVCCNIPEGGVPPTISTTERTDPKETLPSSTIPPVRPGTGNFCGIRNNNGIDFKITGNFDNEAEYGEFPWMLALINKNYDSNVKNSVFAICGASLLTPRIVLTGAHCVAKYRPGQIKVRAGEWDTQSTNERIPYQERDVADIIVHPKFHNLTLANNVAILYLDSPFSKADSVGTVCMPPQNVEFVSRNCFVTGWGKDLFGKEGRYQVILKKIQLPTVPHDQCQNQLRATRLGKFFNLDKSFMCAGGERGKDACTGDGGSPLVCPDPQNPKRYYQAGIVSWGIGCGVENTPGVYADVAKFRTWVDSVVTSLNERTEPYSI